jgi:hypothetical protein
VHCDGTALVDSRNTSSKGAACTAASAHWLLLLGALCSRPLRTILPATVSTTTSSICCSSSSSSRISSSDGSSIATVLFAVAAVQLISLVTAAVVCDALNDNGVTVTVCYCVLTAACLYHIKASSDQNSASQLQSVALPTQSTASTVSQAVIKQPHTAQLSVYRTDSKLLNDYTR